METYVPKEIAALIEDGKMEILRYGKYGPYEITPKYGARPIGENEIVMVVKGIPTSNT